MKDVLCEDYIEEKYSIAPALAMCKVDNDYWFITCNNGCLWKMNLDTGKVHTEAILENTVGSFLFSDIIHYKNKLIITPRRGGNLYTYNLGTKELHKINVCVVEKLGGSLFNSVCLKGKYLYIVPYNHTSIIIFDLDAETFEKISLEANSNLQMQYICWGKAIIADENLLIPSISEKCVLRYNTITRLTDKISPGGQIFSCSHIYFINNKFWMIPYDIADGIRIWNLQTNEIEKIIYFQEWLEEPETLRSTVAAFFRTYYMNDKLYLCACGIEDSFIVDTNNYEIERWNMPYDKEKGGYLQRIIGIVNDGSRVYFINGNSGEWFYFEEGKLRKLRKKANYSEVNIYNGTYSDNLEYLLCLVGTSIKKENLNENKIGEKIFHYMNERGDYGRV